MSANYAGVKRDSAMMRMETMSVLVFVRDAGTMNLCIVAVVFVKMLGYPFVKMLNMIDSVLMIIHNLPFSLSGDICRFITGKGNPRGNGARDKWSDRDEGRDILP